MDDTVDFAALASHDGDHEALIADSDELLLQDAFFLVGFQKALERPLDRLALALDISAQARQGYAGMVGNGAIGQDSAFEIFEQGTEIANELGARAEAWEALSDGVEDAFRVGGAVQHVEEVVDFLAVQAGAFDAQLMDSL